MKEKANKAGATPPELSPQFLEMWEELKREKGNQGEFTYNFEEYSRPLTMVMGITVACNLACPYCFVRQKNQHMSLETAEQAIKWLKGNYEALGVEVNEYNKMPVIFFGGEPLMRFNELIVPLVEKYHNIVNFGITTNGVYLNEDVVDFLYKYNIPPLLSFDGVPEVQNKQRPKHGGKDSFTAVLENIQYLLLRFPGTMMRGTLTRHSIPYLYDSYKMGEELGFREIGFCPNAFEDWTEDDALKFREQLDKISMDIYAKLLNEKEDLPPAVSFIQKAPRRIAEFDWGLLPFNNSLHRCGLGTTGIGVTPDGDLIPCHEKVALPSEVIGSVFTGIDPVKHEAYLQDYLNKVNACTPDIECSPMVANYCLADTCPSRLEDMKYRVSSSLILFSREVLRVGKKFKKLCYKHISPRIGGYFERGEK